MRYRALTSDGDYSFGRGPGEFLINTPAAVAQAVETRLLLISGEWFLDATEGTPYYTQIFGFGTQNSYDDVIRDRILNTHGVQSIDSYSSELNSDNRALSIAATITTIYGQAAINITLSPA